MGYNIAIFDKEKSITQQHFDEVMKKLLPRSKDDFFNPNCDVHFEDEDKQNWIRCSGAFGISGDKAEGFVLDVVLQLVQLGYKPCVVSRDFEYDREEDEEFFDDMVDNNID